MFLTGIPAVIMGHIALKKIKKSGGAIKGAGIALAGTILGYITSLISCVAFLAGLATPIILKAKKQADEVTVINEMRVIGVQLNQDFHKNEPPSYPSSPGELPRIKSRTQGDWHYFNQTSVYTKTATHRVSPPLLVSPIFEQKFYVLSIDTSVTVKEEAEFQATMEQGDGEPVAIPPTHRE